MTVNDWNKCLTIAQDIIDDLESKNIPCTKSTYSIYNGKKGIYLNILDENGDVYQTFASGTHETFIEMQCALIQQKHRITQYHKTHCGDTKDNNNIMSIEDWNKSIILVKHICSNLIKDGITCTYVTDTQNNNQKEIHLNVLDQETEQYVQYNSGTHSTFEDMEKTLLQLRDKIVKQY